MTILKAMMQDISSEQTSTLYIFGRMSNHPSFTYMSSLASDAGIDKWQSVHYHSYSEHMDNSPC